MNTTTAPQRLAAPAPTPAEEEDEGPANTAADKDNDLLHDLCCQWAAWTASRRLWVRPSTPQSVLGKLHEVGMRGPPTGGPNAIASAQLMAFHHAVIAQPSEALDRQVFELHYLTRVRNIKTAAALLGISRQHWYTLLRDFRIRAYRASLEIMDSNLAQAAALPSARYAAITPSEPAAQA